MQLVADVVSPPAIPYLASVGAIASILGFMVSIAVLVVADSAKKAAKEASRAISRRTLAGDLREGGDSVGQLLTYYEKRSWEGAIIYSRRLTKGLTLVLSRWAILLDDFSVGELNMALRQLESIDHMIGRFPTQPPSDTELERVAKSIRRVRHIVTTEIGKQESLVGPGLGVVQ